MRSILLFLFMTQLAFSQGNILWQKSYYELPANGYSWSTPLIMDGKIIWVGQDKAIVAMEESTGNILWADSTNFPQGTYDSPVGYNGTFYIGKGSEWSDQSQISFYAMEAEDGNIVWQKPGLVVSNRSSKPINTNTETIFIASSDALYCLSTKDGSEVWTKTGLYSNVILDNEGTRLFATKSDAPVVEVLQASDGQALWNINIPDEGNYIKGMAYTNLAANDYLVLFPDWDWSATSQYVYCVNLTSQTITWKSDQIGNIGNISGPAILGDMVYAGTQKGSSAATQNIVAFNLLTGTIIWEKPARTSGTTNSPYIIPLDGKVYYENTLNDDYNVVCADAATGSDIWTMKPTSGYEWTPISWGSPLVHNNKLFVSTDGGGFYCYNAGEVNGSWTMVNANIHATNCYVEGLETGIETVDNILPTDYTLSQNYPNPFNPTTQISFSTPNQGFIRLTVYNLIGQEITTLVNEELSAGNYSVEFNAENLSSGIYFYTLNTSGFTTTKKMILMK